MKKYIALFLFFVSYGSAFAQIAPAWSSSDAYRLMMERYSGDVGRGLCPQTTTKKQLMGCKLSTPLGQRYEGGDFFRDARYCAFLTAKKNYCAKGNGTFGGCYELREDCIGGSLYHNCRPKCEYTSQEPFCKKKADCTGSTAKSYCAPVYMNVPTTVLRECPRPQSQCSRINYLEVDGDAKAKECISLGCRFIDGKCIDAEASQCVRGEKCGDDTDCANTPKTPKCDDVGPVGGIQKYCTNGSPSCHEAKCLSFASRIATPLGDIPVTALKVGDLVWTLDSAGNRAVRSLTRISRVAAPNHRVVHLVLADGRALDVSASHPLVAGRLVGDLEVGDKYDGSVVVETVLKQYEGVATYDILPAGDTGYYWANGILMGSTLK